MKIRSLQRYEFAIEIRNGSQDRVLKSLDPAFLLAGIGKSLIRAEMHQTKRTSEKKLRVRMGDR